MEVGRPTDYTPQLLTKAQEYLSSCKDEELLVVKQTNSEKGYQMYDNKLKVKLPSIEGLAVYLRVARSSIYLWAELYPEFSDILEAIKAVQAERLINNGLSGDYNSTIAKLILTKHGYADKMETDLTSGGRPMPILTPLNVHPHNGDNQNSEAQSANTSSTGRDSSKQDNLDTPFTNQRSPERQEAHSDLGSLGCAPKVRPQVKVGSRIAAIASCNSPRHCCRVPAGW